MNYAECGEVFLWARSKLDNHYDSLSASLLVNLVNITRKSLLLAFSPTPNSPNGLELEFLPTRGLYEFYMPATPSSFRTKGKCHFEAFNRNNGEHSVLHVCGTNEISALIRINGHSYILSHIDGKFLFFTTNFKYCDWHTSISSRNKRSDINYNMANESKLLNYYNEYIEGIKRWVELVLIADNTIYKKYGEDTMHVNNRLYSIASTVNSLYAPLNIRITLVWADIWKSKNPIEITEDADKTLRDFLVYRKALLPEHPHDNAHLLTDIRFGSVIGKAYRGTMCSYDYSGGVIVDHSENPVFVGMTVAHEMGHNFGMDHDVEPSCKCPVDSCIMAPASNNMNATSYFSDCSLSTLSSGLARGVDYCLHNLPKMAFGGAKCGNGILEDGEDCDCGSNISCSNNCCIAKECKLAKDAECAEGDCCELKTCKFKLFSNICRHAINICDLPEFCDGKNPSCPADFFVQDGLKCPNDPENYCYQGICGSRKQQCQFIWGPTAENSVLECYKFNEYGSFSGNCGYNFTNEQYIRCNTNDVTCGRLQCAHDSDKPVFGDPSTVYSAYNYIRTKHGEDKTCRVIRTTFIGTGNKKPDPGMVPDGAKCGEDKICVNAMCQNKTEILQMVSRCNPENCNGKGTCNNVGNCHCINEYGGVSCDLPGYGGSVNSGPANNKIFNPGLTLFYCLILLSIFFLIASIYIKRKRGFWIHKKIWSKTRAALELRTFNLVPIRRAPPRPDAKILHTHRQSWNAVWGDGQNHGANEILRVDATRPYAFGGARAIVQQSGNEKTLISEISKQSNRNKFDIKRIDNAKEEQLPLPLFPYDSGGSSSEQLDYINKSHIQSSIKTAPTIPPHGQKDKSCIRTFNNAVENGNEKTAKINVKALAAKFERN